MRTREEPLIPWPPYRSSADLPREPEGKAGERLVVVDVGVGAGADLVLPGGHRSGAAGLVGRIARRAGSVVAAEQGGLERPEVGVAAHSGLGGDRGAPGRGELAAPGSVAVVRRDISRTGHAVIPTFYETRIHRGRACPRVAGRLDVDGASPALGDA